MGTFALSVALAWRLQSWGLCQGWRAGQWVQEEAGPSGTPGGVGESGWLPETCGEGSDSGDEAGSSGRAGRCQEGKEQVGRDVSSSHFPAAGTFSCSRVR